MARTVTEDQIQSFMFQVFEVQGGAGLLLAEEASAGFTAVTTPEVTIGSAEYRTGNKKLTRKLAGPVTYSAGTLNRGILRGDTTFYQWVQAYLSGKKFRADLEIKVFDQESYGVEAGSEKVVMYQKWIDCQPSSVKMMGDLDATTVEANQTTITVEVEDVEFENKAA